VELDLPAANAGKTRLAVAFDVMPNKRRIRDPYVVVHE
jgi:hypothetical protein